jgi:hypothetical protein
LLLPANFLSVEINGPAFESPACLPSRISAVKTNPRPNKEHLRFLHAYPGLDFRPAARPEPPTTGLSATFSVSHRSLRHLFCEFPHRYIH